MKSNEGGGAAFRFEIDLEDQGSFAVSASSLRLPGADMFQCPFSGVPSKAREQRSGIEPRPAQPVDRTIARDQRRSFAVANKSVVLDAFCHGFR